MLQRIRDPDPVVRLIGARSIGALLAACVAGALAMPAWATEPPQRRTTAEILAATSGADWQALDPADTLYLDFAAGRVVIALDPRFAPLTVANLRTLVRERYFDGLAFIRSQDNYVVQWGDAADRRSLGSASAKVPAEFTVPIAAAAGFVRLPDGDGYAPEVGFVGPMPVGRDPAAGRAWLTHCYGMVGVARGDEPDSGNGSQLYVVTGHAPRHLDRNITLIGRVVHGMELLSTLPRGPSPMGFYESADRHVPIARVHFAADLPAAERTPIETLRTDTATFTELVESRRNRPDTWTRVKAGYIELCNVPLPVRATSTPR